MTAMRQFPRKRATPAPISYQQFIQDAKQFVASRGMSWVIPLDGEGAAPREGDWDLRVLTQSHARGASRMNGFALVDSARSAGLAAGWQASSLPAGRVLCTDTQEFIKAAAAHRCQARMEPRGTRHHVLNWRRFFSTVAKAPWELNTEDFSRFLGLAPDAKDTARSMASLATLMNENMLSLNCPLVVDVLTTSLAEMRATLTERDGGEKLPEMEALHELVRIAFREVPQSHQDHIRFCSLRLLVLTGLRLNEVLMLPEDCLRWESHVDVVTGRPAGAIGGTSRTLQLRYFAEKDEAGGPDVLVEKYQWVPEQFHTAVADAVAAARRATAGLRKVLAAQRRDPSSFQGSDLRRFRTASGTQLGTEDLLFLVLPRVRGHLPKCLRRSESVGVISATSLYAALRTPTGHKKTSLFIRYGSTELSRALTVRPHSLRHLMNTELFRLDVPDTVITHHFGRRTVVQSYLYDHRNLAEKLDFVRLPSAAQSVVAKGSIQELVAKMVVSGSVGTSHIARSFKVIQEQHGDKAAFKYLAANSDGFHVTPYGFCSNSFSVNPCQRHLKCFDSCRHFVVSGRPEHRVTLEQLKARLIEMRAKATAKPTTTIGRKNQIVHADKLLWGVDAALAAQEGDAVFPGGADHSTLGKDFLR